MSHPRGRPQNGHRAAAGVADGNRIAGIVMVKGPLTTRALRRESGMAGKRHRYRFMRALIEAESQYLIAKSGISHEGISRYSYLWESFEGLFPETIRQSKALGIETAGAEIVTQYLKTVIAGTARQIAVIFTLNRAFVEFVVERLAEDGKVIRQIEDDEEYILSRETDLLLRS